MDENGLVRIGLSSSSAPSSSSHSTPLHKRSAAPGTGNSKSSNGNMARKALGNLSVNVTNLSGSERRTPDKMDGKSLMKALSSPLPETKSTEYGTNLEIVEKHRNSKASKGLSEKVQKTVFKSGTYDKSSCKYELNFPAGAMGLDLEPVVISSTRQVGCRVKDYYFDLEHDGIDPTLVQSTVSLGDVLDSIDGQSVLSIPFPDIVTMLRSLKSKSRVVVFRRMTLDCEDTHRLSLQHLDSYSPSSSLSSEHSKKLVSSPRPSTSVPVHPVTPVPAQELLFSPKAVKRLSESNVFSPTTYSYLSSFEPVGERTIKQKDCFDQDTNPIAQVFGQVATAVKEKAFRAALAVTDVISERAEQAIESTVESLPRFSALDMEGVMSRKNALLSELSQCCVLLGVAEERETFLLSQVKSSKLREVDLIGRLGDAEHTVLQQSSKILSLELETATVMADRDSWQTRCLAAETELVSSNLKSSECERELVSLRTEVESLRINSAENADTIESLQEELERGNIRISGLRDQLSAEQQCRVNEQKALRDEVNAIVSEQKSTREEIENAFATAEVDLKAAEVARDSALCELESMKDFMASQNTSHELEVTRLRDALEQQKTWAVQRIAEKDTEIQNLSVQISSDSFKVEDLSLQLAVQSRQTSDIMKDLELVQSMKKDAEVLVMELQDKLVGQFNAERVAAEVRDNLMIENTELKEKIQQIESDLSKRIVEGTFLLSQVSELTVLLSNQQEESLTALSGMQHTQSMLRNDLAVTQSDLHTLSQEHQSVIEQRDSLKLRLADAIEANSCSERLILDLQGKLETALTSSSAFEQDVSDAKKRFESVQSDMNNVVAELDRCRGKVREQETSLHVAQEELKAADDRNTSLLSSLELLANREKSLTYETAETSERIDSLSCQLEEYKASNANLNSELSSLLIYKENTSSELSAAAERIKCFEAEVESLILSKDTLSNELSTLSDQNRSLVLDLSVSVTSCTELTNQLGAVRREAEMKDIDYNHIVEGKASLEVALSEQQTAYQQLVRDCMDQTMLLNGQVADLEQQLEISRSLLVESEKRFIETQEALLASNQSVLESVSVQRRLDQLSNDKDILQEALASMEVRYRESLEKVSSLEAVKDELEASLQTHAQNLENIGLEHARVTGMYAEQSDEKERSIQVLSEKIRQLETGASESADRIRDVDARYLKMQSELEGLLKLKEDTLASTRSELADVREAYRQLMLEQSCLRGQEASGFSSLVASFKDFAEEVKTKSSQLGALQSRYDETVIQLREYKTMYLNSSANIEMLEVQLKASSERIALLELDVKTSQEYLVRYEKESADMVSSLGALREELECSLGRCSTLETEAKAATRRADETVQQESLRVMVLEEKLRTLERSLEEAAASQALSDERVVVLSAEIEAVKIRSSEIEQSCELSSVALDQQISLLRDLLAASSSEKDALSSHNDNLEASLNSVTIDNARLLNELSTTTSKLSAVECECARIQSLLSCEQQMSGSRISELEVELSLVRECKESIDIEKSSVVAQLLGLQASDEMYKTKISELKVEKEQQSEALACLEIELAVASQGFKAAEEERQMLASRLQSQQEKLHAVLDEHKQQLEDLLESKKVTEADCIELRREIDELTAISSSHEAEYNNSESLRLAVLADQEKSLERITELEQKVSLLIQEKSVLEIELSSKEVSTETVAALQAELADCLERLSYSQQLESDLEASRGSCTKLQEQISSKDTELAELNATVSVVQSSIQSLSDNLELLRGTLLSREQEVIHLTARNMDLTHELNDVHVKLQDHVKQQLETSKSSGQDSVCCGLEMEQLQVELKHRESECVVQQERIDDLNSRIHVLSQENSQLISELSSVRSIVLEREDAFDSLQVHVAHLNGSILELSAQIVSLNSSSASLQVELEDTRKLLSERDVALYDMKSKIESMKTETQLAIDQEIGRYNTDCVEFQERCDALLVEIEELRSERDTFQQTIEEAGEQIAISFEKLLAQEMYSADLEKSCESLKQQLEEEVLVVEGLRDSDEGLRNRLSEVKCLLATEQKNNELLVSTMTTMTTALSEAQHREEEHEKHTQLLLARLSVVRGEDLFQSLETKLRDTSTQLVTAKALVLELEQKILDKNQEIAILKRHGIVSDGVGPSLHHMSMVKQQEQQQEHQPSSSVVIVKCRPTRISARKRDPHVVVPTEGPDMLSALARCRSFILAIIRLHRLVIDRQRREITELQSELHERNSWQTALPLDTLRDSISSWSSFDSEIIVSEINQENERISKSLILNFTHRRSLRILFCCFLTWKHDILLQRVSQGIRMPIEEPPVVEQDDSDFFNISADSIADEQDTSDVLLVLDDK